MGRNQSIRSNFGRKNNGQLSYCSICNVHITKITRHEQSKRHIMMSRQHASNSERSFLLSQNDERCTPVNDLHISRLEQTTIDVPNHTTGIHRNENICNASFDEERNEDIESYNEMNSLDTNDSTNISVEISSDSETELSNHSDDENLDNSNEDEMYLQKYLLKHHFSSDDVNKQRNKLETYRIQIKLLKILSDEGACPKIFDLVMEWVKENFVLKQNITPHQRFRTRETLMKAVKNTYSEFAGGPIKTKLISLDTSSCLVHQSVFLKNIYRLLNNKYLMEDAQWLPLDEKIMNETTNTEEKVYSEVTSGSWYKRTYDKMKFKHRTKHSPYPALLVAIVLGQDGTLCDKLGRVSAEPVLVSVANISYQKRKNIMLGFVLGLYLHILKLN